MFEKYCLSGTVKLHTGVGLCYIVIVRCVAYCTDGVYLSDLLGFSGTCFAIHGQMLVNWLID